MASSCQVLNCVLFLFFNGILVFGFPYELMVVTESGYLMDLSLPNIMNWKITLSSSVPLPVNVSSLAVDNDVIIYHAHAVMTKKFPYSARNSSTVFDLGELSSVTVDRRHGNIYFYQPIFQVIGLTSYTKENEFFSYRTILRQVIHLTDIAVESKKGALFWITNNKIPMIHAAGLLGENPVDIIYFGMITPSSLVVDSNTERIMWLDSAKGTLECSDFFGGNRQVIDQSNGIYKGIVPLHEDLTLAFDDNSIFLLNESTSRQVHLKLNESIQKIALKESFVSKDMCNKQQCSEMCSFSFGETRCICYDWHTLQLNNRDCVPPQKYTYSGLFAVVDRQICVTDIAEITKREEYNLNLNLYCLNFARNVTDLEFDISTKAMYYISTKENNWILSRHNLGYDGSSELTSSNFPLNGLSINENDSSLFYGDGHKIKRLKQSNIYTVVEDDDDVQDLTLDSEKSYLFWVTSKNYYIWRSNIDGSNIRRLIAALNINKLSIFPKQGRLFWSAYGGIMSSELDSGITDVNIVRTGNIKEISFYQNLGIWLQEGDDDKTKMCYFQFSSSGQSSCFNITGNASSIYIYDEALKIKQEDFCWTHNGGCGQLCLPYNRTCSCNPGFAITQDRTSCQEEHSNDTNAILVDNIMTKIYLLDKSTFQLRSAIQTNYTVRSIAFDSFTGNIYVAYSQYVLEIDVHNLGNSTIKLQGYDIKHVCVIATSIIFTSEEQNSTSLLLYNKSTGIITTIANDLRQPGDVLCEYNSGFVFISERRSTYSVRRIHVTDNSSSHIQIGNKQGDYRLSLYSTDEVFYCLDIDTSVIYDVTFEGKSGYFFSTSRYTLLDFDVDEKYVYGILRQERFILKINRSDTTLTKIISISPLFGRLQFIVLPTVISDDMPKNTSSIVNQHRPPDSSPNITAIVLPIVLVLVVASGGAACFFFRKRLKEFGNEFRKEKKSLDIDNRPQPGEPAVIYRSKPNRNQQVVTKEYTAAGTNKEVYVDYDTEEFYIESDSSLTYSYADDGAPEISRRVSIRAPPTSDD